MSFFEFPHTRTYDSDLGWLIKDYKTLNEAIAALNSWKEETQPTIDDFKALYDAIVKGDLPEGMKEGMYAWLVENAIDIIGSLATMVFFTLKIIDGAGYLCVNIPENWSDIIFGTSGLDDFPPDTDFGHLTLSLNIGG